MRKIINLSFMALTIMAITVSCDTGSDNTISTNIQQGKWKITSFSENGVSQTGTFTNYEFTFASNGIVTAVKAGQDVNGTWSSGMDNNLEKLLMAFSNNPLDGLNKNWRVFHKSLILVKLEYVSGGGITNLLTFERP